MCGAGPIGLLTALALKRRGAKSVAVTDLHDRPLKLARHLGAEATFRIGDDDEIPNSHYDIAIAATGVPASLDAALGALRAGGILLQLGMLAGAG